MTMNQKGYRWIAILVPVLALGLPLFDTSVAIVRRLKNGKSPFHADRGHLHHRLIDRGLDQKQAVSVLYSLSLFGGCVAVILSSGFNAISLVGFVCILGLLLRGNRTAVTYKEPDHETKSAEQ